MQILDSTNHLIRNFFDYFALSIKCFHIGFFGSVVVLKVDASAASFELDFDALISKTSPFQGLYFTIFNPFENYFIVYFIDQSCDFIIFESFILQHADFHDSADATGLTWLVILEEVCLIALPSSLYSNFKL